MIKHSSKMIFNICLTLLILSAILFTGCGQSTKADAGGDFEIEQLPFQKEYEKGGVKYLVLSDFEEKEKTWVFFNNIDEIGVEQGTKPEGEGYFDWAPFAPAYAKKWDTGLHYYQKNMELGNSWNKEFIRSGKSSLLIDKSTETTRICAKDFPKDWSKYNFVSFWMYNAVPNGNGITFVAYSDDLSEPGDDYFKKAITLNWEGWKLVEIPFKQFLTTRKPIGWNQVDYIKIGTSGWGNVPAVDTKFYLDTLRLTDKSIVSLYERKVEVNFPEQKHPYLFINKDDIKEIKEKIATEGWAKTAYTILEQSANPFLTEAIVIPDTGGGFYHLEGMGQKFPYYITEEHYKLARGARSLALMYQFTGNKEYMKKAKFILNTYAKKYKDYELHDKYDNIGEKANTGGKATPQAMNEAKWIIPLAWAYDLIYSNFSKKEKSVIENDLFRVAADIINGPKEGKHNHQSWYNAGVGVVGFLLQDADYVRAALFDVENGFYFQMANSITEDGMWYEGSAHYQFYTMNPLLDLSEAAYTSGFDLYKEVPYRKYYTFPIRFTNPRGECPTINDGKLVQITDEYRTEFFEVMYKRTKDPIYLPILNKAARSSLKALIYGETNLEKKDLDSLDSMLINGALAVLRAPNNKLYATLNGLPYGGGHSHYDKLSITLFGLDKWLAQDTGSIKYRDPRHTGYFKYTVAHNTVVVDRQVQKYVAQAKVDYFSGGPVYQTSRMTSEDMNPGTVSNRTLLMSDWYMVDLLQSQSTDGADHFYEYSYRNGGLLESKLAYKPVDLSSAGNGYDFLEKTQVAKTSGDLMFSWDQQNDTMLDLYSYGNKVVDVVKAKVMMAANDGDEVRGVRFDGILIGKKAKDALFSNVFVPVEKGMSYSVQKIAVNSAVKSENLGAIKLKKGNVEDIVVYNRDNVFIDVEVSGIKTDAKTAVIRYVDGKLASILITQASYLITSDGEIRLGPEIANNRMSDTVLHINFVDGGLELVNDKMGRVLTRIKGYVKTKPVVTTMSKGKEKVVKAVEETEGYVKYVADKGNYTIK